MKTMTETSGEKATRIVAELRRNADAYHFRAIDHDTFSARNHAIWRDAETTPQILEQVRAMLREAW